MWIKKGLSMSLNKTIECPKGHKTGQYESADNKGYFWCMICMEYWRYE